MMIVLPSTLGSWKLGMPFLRMHFAHAATFVASKDRLLAAAPVSPCTSFDWQADWADLKVGEFWSMSAGTVSCTLP